MRLLYCTCQSKIPMHCVLHLYSLNKIFTPASKRGANVQEVMLVIWYTVFHNRTRLHQCFSYIFHSDSSGPEVSSGAQRNCLRPPRGPRFLIIFVLVVSCVEKVETSSVFSCVICTSKFSHQVVVDCDQVIRSPNWLVVWHSG